MTYPKLSLLFILLTASQFSAQEIDKEMIRSSAEIIGLDFTDAERFINLDVEPNFLRIFKREYNLD